jgi:hypothetical protein
MPTFYRVVRTNPPTEADFASHRARGVPLQHDTPEHRRSWEGVSVTSTLDAARGLAATFPRLGTFIAVLDLQEGGPVLFEQTLGSPTHYDLWGEPRAMLAAVVAVVPA